MHRKVKKPNRPSAKQILSQCESDAMLHFYAAVAQQNQSATLLTPKMRVQLLPAANLGVTVIGTANPCKIERRGAIPRISTNYPVAQQNQSASLRRKRPRVRFSPG